MEWYDVASAKVLQGDVIIEVNGILAVRNVASWSKPFAPAKLGKKRPSYALFVFFLLFCRLFCWVGSQGKSRSKGPWPVVSVPFGLRFGCGSRAPNKVLLEEQKKPCEKRNYGHPLGQSPFPKRYLLMIVRL